MKLKSKTNKVFLIVQPSLELASMLFKKGKQMGMMEKCYVWVIPDGVAALLNSVNSSVIFNMQHLIRFKTRFIEMSENFKQFKI